MSCISTCDNLRTLHWLQSQGCDVTSADQTGMTPLHVAAGNSQLGCARALVVDYGAEVEARAANGSTPLYLAASRGNADMIKLLASLGADPNAVGES